MKVEIGKSYLKEIPHEGGSRTFQHPSFSGTYGKVADAIDKEGLQRPNSAETASLVYDAFQNSEGQYESEVIGILNKRGFWEFTGNLYLPKSKDEVNNGVILEDNPTVTNGRLNMDKQSLVKRLQDGDSLVRFVPFGFKVGEQTVKELGENPYLVARYGGEGAEKIAEVASKYKYNPKLWSFDSVDEEKERMSALYRGWDFGDRLYVVGDDWFDDGRGRAFGVVPNKRE